MKNIIFAIAVSAISLTACNDSSNKSTEPNTTNDRHPVSKPLQLHPRR
jgi:hypothetical protein